jgi:hypothetical protein
VDEDAHVNRDFLLFQLFFLKLLFLFLFKASFSVVSEPVTAGIDTNRDHEGGFRQIYNACYFPTRVSPWVFPQSV